MAWRADKQDCFVIKRKISFWKLKCLPLKIWGKTKKSFINKTCKFFNVLIKLHITAAFFNTFLEILYGNDFYIQIVYLRSQKNCAIFCKWEFIPNIIFLILCHMPYSYHYLFKYLLFLLKFYVYRLQFFFIDAQNIKAVDKIIHFSINIYYC